MRGSPVKILILNISNRSTFRMNTMVSINCIFAQISFYPLILVRNRLIWVVFDNLKLFQALTHLGDKPAFFMDIIVFFCRGTPLTAWFFIFFLIGQVIWAFFFHNWLVIFNNLFSFFGRLQLLCRRTYRIWEAILGAMRVQGLHRLRETRRGLLQDSRFKQPICLIINYLIRRHRLMVDSRIILIFKNTLGILVHNLWSRPLTKDLLLYHVGLIVTICGNFWPKVPWHE